MRTDPIVREHDVLVELVLPAQRRVGAALAALVVRHGGSLRVDSNGRLVGVIAVQRACRSIRAEVRRRADGAP
jgi:hypothetical protein